MHRKQIPMNIQFFAEPPAGGEGGGTTTSFDDFLKTGENQAEFDKRIQQAVSTAVSSAEEKWKLLTDDKVSEAEKLAKMNKDEKNEYLRKKQEKALSDREAAVTKKELMAEAKNTLAEKKLPSGLASVLDYTDAEACKKSIETIETVFREAVEAAVEEKLKGGNPPKKAPDNETATLEKQIEAIMMRGYY